MQKKKKERNFALSVNGNFPWHSSSDLIKTFNCVLSTSLNVIALLNQATKLSNYMQVSKNYISNALWSVLKLA